MIITKFHYDFCNFKELEKNEAKGGFVFFFVEFKNHSRLVKRQRILLIFSPPMQLRVCTIFKCMQWAFKLACWPRSTSTGNKNVNQIMIFKHEEAWACWLDSWSSERTSYNFVCDTKAHFLPQPTAASQAKPLSPERKSRPTSIWKRFRLSFPLSNQVHFI